MKKENNGTMKSSDTDKNEERISKDNNSDGPNQDNLSNSAGEDTQKNRLNTNLPEQQNDYSKPKITITNSEKKDAEVQYNKEVEENNRENQENDYQEDIKCIRFSLITRHRKKAYKSR